MAPGTRTPILLALTAAALFGASVPLAQLLLGAVQPVMLAALLYIGGGTAVVGARLVRGRSTGESPLARRDLPWLAGTMLAGGFLAPVLLMVSLTLTPAATASLLLNAEAVATALIAAAFFAEGIGRRVWAAIGVITAAGTVLSFDPDGHLGLSLGALGVLGACALWGLDNNCSRQISSKDPFAIGTVKGLGAGLLSLPLALALGEAVPPLEVALPALLLGAACYGASMICFILALRSLGAARTAGVFGLAPFIGAGLALLIAPVVPGWQFLVALPLMAAGALLIAREEHAHEHRHEPVTHAHRHRHDDPHHRHVHEEGGDVEVHAHVHVHDMLEHAHAHTPDIHHRHRH
jgi:drug/metabolite transporter (DMT)-like permease